MSKRVLISITLISKSYIITQHNTKNNTVLQRKTTPTYNIQTIIKYVCQIIKDYPLIDFIRVIGPTTAKIAEFDAFGNLRHMSLIDFVACINNEKEL